MLEFGFPCIGIEPTQDWIYILEIGFMVAGNGSCFYYNLQSNKLDKERMYEEKKCFMHVKNI